MPSERLSIRVGFVALCLIWGSTWLAIKIGLDSVPPFYGVALRFLVALIVLYGIMKARRLKIPRDRRSRNLFVAVGVLSFGLPFGIIYYAEQYLPSGLMSILFAAFPFVVVMFSHLVLPDEKINAFKLVGIALGFSGIVLVFSNGLSWNGGSAIWAMGAVLLCTVFQGAGMILVKKNGKEVNPVVLNFAGMLVGVVLVAGPALMFERLSDIRFDAKGIGSILYLGTMGSVVTFVVYFWLLKRIEAVYLSLVAFVTPITAVFLGAIVLDESLESNTFIGAALVLLGILVANGRALAGLASKSDSEKPLAG